MKRPAFQWYPGDHRRDTALQACSFGARALWREILDLMHDGEPYGHLTGGGVAITDSQLARMIPGVTAKKVQRWLAELEQRKVFSRTEAGVIYSRRMVEDERRRLIKGAHGIKSLENPNVPRRKGTAEDGDKDTINPSMNGSPAVAVSSLQFAAAKIGQTARRRNNSTARLEASELVQRIAGFAERQVPSGVRTISRTKVEALGPEILRAFDAVGPRRFVDIDAKTLPFVIMDFEQVLDGVRTEASS